MGILLTITVTVYITVFSIILVDNELYKKVLNIGIFFLGTCITEVMSVGISTIVLHFNMEQLSRFGVENIICATISKILLYFLCYTFCFRKSNKLIFNLYGNK